MPPDDGELWNRARTGDTGAFGSLYDRHANAVYGYCFRRTADWALAEDLTSVVFLEAWRKRRATRLPADKVLPWLLGVATNVLRNRRRAVRRYESALGRLPRPEPEPDFADDLADRLADEERMRAALELVRRLPGPEQDAFALCAWQGLSSAEAGFVLGVPEATVRTRLFRARARLRELVAEPVELSTPEMIDVP